MGGRRERWEGHEPKTDPQSLFVNCGEDTLIKTPPLSLPIEDQQLAAHLAVAFFQQGKAKQVGVC